MQSINELKENYSIITVHGLQEVYIENFISIIELGEHSLKLRARKEIILIEGSKLIIEYMNSDDINVKGHIEHIRLVEVTG